MTQDDSFQFGVRCHQAGDLVQAEKIYRQVLGGEPKHADALNLLGVLLNQSGRQAEAAEALSRAIALRPNTAVYHYHLGLVRGETGNLAEAEAEFRRAWELAPTFLAALNNLGLFLEKEEKLAEAAECFGRLTSLQPENSEFQCNHANALFRMGRLEESDAAYRRAIALRPDFAAAMNNLGTVLGARGKWEQAITFFRSALKVQPGFGDALNNLGNAYLNLHQPEQAVVAFEAALGGQPDFPDALNNLGNALCDLGRLSEAEAALRKALNRRPRWPEALNNLSRVLRLQGEKESALDVVRQALAIRPNDSISLTNLGLALCEKGELDEGIAAYRRATEIAPRDAGAWSGLAHASLLAGAVEQSIQYYDRALEAAPSDATAESSRLFAMQFCPGIEAPDLLEAHRAWNEHHAKQWKARPHENSADPGRRLRIGYVSPDFRGHCQSLFTIPLLSNHDREQVEVFCYADVARPDGVTQRLRSLDHMWRETTGWDDAKLAEAIGADRIDILVDLTMHMANGRPGVFARKPAPVQVCWLAYPGTTGLAAMDYRLTDPYLDPPGEHDACYTEQSIRLPDTFWCYDPYGMEPDPTLPLAEPGPLPMESNGFVTFGCLNNFCKINDGVLGLWAKVLGELAGSHLRMLAPKGECRRRTLGQLAAAGIEGSRVEFIEFQPRRAYLAEFRGIDIILDTLPYNGHTTSLDSFWMGVPVITRIGSTVAGRAGFSQLRNLGLPQLAADKDDAFVQIAVNLATNSRELGELRRELRERMCASPLCNAGKFASSIEAAYRRMWETWCCEMARRCNGS